MLLRTKDLLWKLKHPRTMLKVWYANSDSALAQIARKAMLKLHPRSAVYSRRVVNTLLMDMPSERHKDTLMRFLAITRHMKQKARSIYHTHEPDEFKTAMALYMSSAHQLFSQFPVRNLVTNESDFSPSNYQSIVDEMIDGWKLMKDICPEGAHNEQFRDAANAFCELFEDNRAAISYAELKSTIVGCFAFFDVIDNHC